MSRIKPGAALVLVFLIGLSMGWLYPAHAQVIHENPANLTTQQPFDINGKLMLQLEQMFGALDGVSMHINASDFDASRLSMADYEQYYKFFKDYLSRTSLSGSDYQRIVGQADLTSAELRSMIADSEGFNNNMALFEKYWEDGDSMNATLTAVELQKYFDTMNGTSRQLTVGASVISQMLRNTSVNTNHLDAGVNTLNTFMDRMSELNQLPLSLLGNTNLTLNASQQNFSTGDIVAFTGYLESNGTAVGGGQVTLYVDGEPAGNGTTSPDGYCTIYYQVKGGTFASTMSAVAYFDPGATNYTPAVSNSVTLERNPIPTGLTIKVTPRDARFGDTVLVQGRLTADGGYPVPGHLISVYFPGRPACYATTAADGSYSCEMYITAHIPAGEIEVISMFEAYTMPGEALTAPPAQHAMLRVLQESTSLTLDPPPVSLSGGQNITFSGTLTSSTGRPVSGEDISIYTDSELIASGLATDDTGHYSATVAVPLSLTAGQHYVYAVYAHDAGMSLAGSQSGKYEVIFHAAKPEITVSGIPQVAFQGDMMNLTGKVTAPQGPGIQGLTLTIGVPNMTLGSVVTGPNGTFRFSEKIVMPAGAQPVTITSEPKGLLLSAPQEVGSMYVMPFDLPTSVIIVIFILLVIGLILSRVTGVRRVLSRALRPRRQPLPKPTVKVTPLPEPPTVPVSPPPRFRLEDEIVRIEAIVSKGGDQREIITEIYQTLRRVAGIHGFTMPDSATHREFFKSLTVREPSLVASAGTITKNYESAVFGHISLGEKDIVNSLNSLREINGIMSLGKIGGSR